MGRPTLVRSTPVIAVLALVCLVTGCSLTDFGSAATTTTPPPGTAGTPTTSPATPVPSPTSSPASTLPPAAPEWLCDSFADAVVTGSLAITDVTEASGIVASRRHPDVLWTHNDSGGGSFIYAFDTSGADLGTFEIDAPSFDWEDVAIGPGPGSDADYIYVGDIGDNLLFRPAVTVYRIPEPDPSPDGGFVEQVDTIDLRYPQGSVDAEAMLVDPVTGDLLIVTKGDAGDPADIYRAPGNEIADGATIDLEYVGTFALESGAFVTGADIDSDGRAVIFRGYNQVWLWERLDLSFTETFAAEPCRTPSTAEIQGEAIAFAPDGFSYFTISEGSDPDINFVESVVP